MSLLRKPKPSVEPPSWERPHSVDPAEAEAEDLVSFAPTLDDDERATVQKLLANAAREQKAAGREGELRLDADVIREVAQGLGDPTPTRTARELATAEADRAAYRVFMAEGNLSDTEEPEAEWLARVNLGMLERRRIRLEQKLAAGRMSPERRDEVESEIATLEQQETEFFSFLHPPLIGSVWGIYERDEDEVDPNRPMFGSRCRWCDHPIDRHRAFTHGCCTTCERLNKLVHDSVNGPDPERKEP